MTAALQKDKLREHARIQRDRIADRGSRSRLLFDALRSSALYRDAASIVCYVSFRSEVETQSYLPELIDERHVFVPYVESDELRLFKLQSMQQLRPGRFGILEPEISLRPETPIELPTAGTAIVIVPGLAFDRRGHRLGYGRGYYDRFLSKLEALRIGMAFEAQVVAEVPDEAHDLPMDYLLTESGLQPTMLGRSVLGRSSPD